MFDASAEFYDTIYGAFKDYTAEATKIANMLGSPYVEDRINA